MIRRIKLAALIAVIVIAIAFIIVSCTKKKPSDSAEKPAAVQVTEEPVTAVETEAPEVYVPEETPEPTPELTAEPMLEITPESGPAGEPAETEAEPDAGEAGAEPVMPAAPVVTVDTIVAFENEQSADGSALRSARIRSVGDFVIHEQLYTQAKALGRETQAYKYDFTPMLSYIRDYFADADYTVANVDGPMGGEGKRGYASYPQFNTPEDLIPILKDCGVDMLTLSNNHALDTYFDGFKAQIKNLQACGMDYCGGAATQQEHDTPVIREINGIKIGFLNYTTSTNTMENYCSKDAVKYGVNTVGNANFSKDVKAMRAAGAEVIVAYMHWGKEYERTPNADQRTYAKKLAKAGVDVIIGSHPHVVQPTYWLSTGQEDGTVKKCLCVCSLGNFISNQRKSVNKKGETELEYTDEGILFDFTIRETEPGKFEIVAPAYIPIYVWRTDTADGGFMYNVLPIGDYYAERPDGMADADYERMKEAYGEVIDWLGTEIKTYNW